LRRDEGDGEEWADGLGWLVSVRRVRIPIASSSLSPSSQNRPSAQVNRLSKTACTTLSAGYALFRSVGVWHRICPAFWPILSLWKSACSKTHMERGGSGRHCLPGMTAGLLLSRGGGERISKRSVTERFEMCRDQAGFSRAPTRAGTHGTRRVYVLRAIHAPTRANRRHFIIHARTHAGHAPSTR
jgi:hypothetical protein